MNRPQSQEFIRARATQEKTPWLWFIFLTVILMFCQHNYRLDKAASDESDADTYISVYESGDIHRRIGFPLLGLVGLFAVWQNRRRRLHWRSPIMWLVVFLWLWAGASFLWSINPPMTVRRFMILTFILLGAVGAASKWSPRQAVNWIVFCGSYLLAIGVVREIYLGRFAIGDPFYRFAGTTHTNQQGQLCAVLALAALAGVRLNPKYRLLFFSAFLFGLTFLVLTKSRTSFAGFLAGLSVYLFLVLPPAKRLRLIFLTVMILLIAAMLAGEVGVGAFQNFLLLGRSDDTVSNLTGRVPLWGICSEYIKDRPIAGYGYAAFWTPIHIDDISFASQWNIHEAHSAYVDLLLNLGAVGFFLHTALLLAVFFRSIRYFRVSGDASYALIAGLVVGWLILGSLESSMLTKDSTPSVILLVLIVLVGVKPPRELPRPCAA